MNVGAVGCKSCHHCGKSGHLRKDCRVSNNTRKENQEKTRAKVQKETKRNLLSAITVGFGAIISLTVVCQRNKQDGEVNKVDDGGQAGIPPDSFAPENE